MSETRILCEEAQLWMVAAEMLDEARRLPGFRPPIQHVILAAHAWNDRQRKRRIPAWSLVERLADVIGGHHHGPLSPEERVIAALLIAEFAQSDHEDSMAAAAMLCRYPTFTASGGGTACVTINFASR